jgi:biotin carboxyl carrier protein
MRYLARIGGTEFTVEATRRGSGRCSVRLQGEGRPVETRAAGASILFDLGGRRVEAVVSREGASGDGGERFAVTIGGRSYPVVLADPLSSAAATAAPGRDGPVEVRSIMPGRVAALLVCQGDQVEAGQGVVVVEAMKMENEMPAPKQGRVTAIRVRPGDTVETGALLFTVE